MNIPHFRFAIGLANYVTYPYSEMELWSWSTAGVCKQHPMDPIQLTFYFLYGLWAMNIFYILNGWKKSKEEQYFIIWKLHEIQTSVSVKIFYFCTAVLFVFVLSVAAFVVLCHNWVIAVEILWPIKPKIFTTWTFLENVC